MTAVSGLPGRLQRLPNIQTLRDIPCRAFWTGFTDQQRALLAASYSREQFRPRVLVAAHARWNEPAALVEMWEISGLGDIAAPLDRGDP